MDGDHCATRRHSLTLIGEAVFARCLSAIKEQRVAASKVLPGPQAEFTGDRAQFISDLEQAVYAAKIISYTQGYMLMQDAARSYNWNLNYGGVALMWREGCIIRSAFLSKIQEAYATNPGLANLLLDDYFSEAVITAQAAWRGAVATGITQGIPLPIMSGALAFYDGFRSAICRRICCKRSGITSGRILTSGWTVREASIFTRIGRAPAAM